jgi:hypothetical protein
MRLIAHRGLINGPNSEIENSPSQIEIALSYGFNVEVDVYYVDGEWFTGHDQPTYKVSLNWLKNKNFWIHCKNNEAFEQMTYMSPQLHYFWHYTDTYTLTSANVPWVYPGNKLFKTSVCVLPENFMQLKDVKKLDVYGICSDYIQEIREILK